MIRKNISGITSYPLSIDLKFTLKKLKETKLIFTFRKFFAEENSKQTFIA